MATGAVGENMERIWVMHMIDPETFWFVGADDEAFRKEKDECLTEFMKNQVTTSDRCQLYTPVVGQLVAVQNPGTSLWQRAEVQEVAGSNGNQCYIFLVDHGIAVTVPTSMIRPIPKNSSLCNRDTFSSSRLRLRGLSPITTEISSDGNFKPKLTAASEWDTSAFEFVSHLLRSADSCYMSNDLESYSYVDGMIFGEVYLGIKGELVSVIDELVGKNYAGRKSDPQQDALNYKNDPNCLSLGPNLRDERQASNPMGIQISNRSLQQAKESEDFDEEIGGLAIKRKDRSHLLSPIVDKSSADLAEKETATYDDNIQYFPAGLSVNSLPRTIPSKSASVAKLGSVTTNPCEVLNVPKRSLADVPKPVTQSQNASTVPVVESRESILTAHTRRLKELLKIVDVVPAQGPEVSPSKVVLAAASLEVNPSKVVSAAASLEVSPRKDARAATSPEVSPSKDAPAAASPEVSPSQVVSAAASLEVNPSKDMSAAVSPEINPRVARLSQRLLKSMIKSGTVKPEANVPNQDVEQKLEPTEKVVVEADSSGTRIVSNAVGETVTAEVSPCRDSKQKARRRSDKVLEQIRARAQKIDASGGTSQEYVASPRAVGVSPSKTESPKLGVHVGGGDVLETSSNTASPTTSPVAFKFKNLMAGLKKLIEEEDKVDPLNVA